MLSSRQETSRIEKAMNASFNGKVSLISTEDLYKKKKKKKLMERAKQEAELYGMDDNMSVGTFMTSDSLGSFDSSSIQFNNDYGGSLSSQRSIGSIGSDVSDYSLQSLMSSRELVYMVEKSARLGRSKPSFVQSMNELPPSKVTWNGIKHRVKRRKNGKHNRNPHSHLTPIPQEIFGNQTLPNRKNRPVVNIIGCHQSTELILARADERVRKENTIRKQKAKEIEKAREHLVLELNKKGLRIERAKELKKVQMLTYGWLRIIGQFRLENILKNSSRTILKFQRQHKASTKITLWLKNAIHQKRIRVGAKMKGALQNLNIIIRARILRKRQCVKTLIRSIESGKDNHKVTRIIHKFLIAVHFVQKHMRNFVVCKDNRINTLMKRWEKVELKYCKDQFEARKKLKNSGQDFANAVENIKLDEKTQIEMGKQAAAWERASHQMHQALYRQQQTGVLSKSKLGEQLRSLMLSKDHVRGILKKLVEEKRIEFMYEQSARRARMARKLLDFKVDDAKSLLLGGSDAAQEMASRFDNVHIGMEPFTVHRRITNQDMYQIIHHEHSRKGTFITVKKGESELEKRRKILKKKQEEEERAAARKAAKEQLEKRKQK